MIHPDTAPAMAAVQTYCYRYYDYGQDKHPETRKCFDSMNAAEESAKAAITETAERYALAVAYECGCSALPDDIGWCHTKPPEKQCARCRAIAEIEARLGDTKREAE